MFGKGFTLGHFFGIQIRIDWSWVFIFLLVVWNLISVFQQFHADWSSTLRLILAVAAALLFFLSVLAHELAHSLVAKGMGLPVKDIVLFLFGGVSNITREPRSPREEFLVAAAGPFISLVLGAAMLLGVRGSLEATRQSASVAGVSLASMLNPLETILLWLGAVNVILAAFNLIPGFPLDGGRVLRSILWGATRSLKTATRLAAWIGQAIAWVMIIVGIAMAFGVTFPLLGSGIVNGLWLVFVGWFLNNASAQSYAQVQIKDIMEGVQVSRLMKMNPATVEPGCSVDCLMRQHLMDADDQAFPVIDDGRLIGIVSLDDVRRAQRDRWDSTTVTEIMTPYSRLVTTTPEEAISDALEKLVQRDIRQLPVMEEGSRFVGLLRRRDIMRWMRSRVQV